MSIEFNFWKWFFCGSGGRSGLRRLVNHWLILHLCIGALLSFVISVDLQTSANCVLLPLAAIFIGLSFAWAGNAQALMQSPEIDRLANHHKGGFAEYAYAFQTSILVILVTMVLWGLAGLRVFAIFESQDAIWWTKYAARIPLFGLSSMTLRECWHVVLGSQWMLLAQREIRRKLTEQKDQEEKEKNEER
jgi:hypothetical protein